MYYEVFSPECGRFDEMKMLLSKLVAVQKTALGSNTKHWSVVFRVYTQHEHQVLHKLVTEQCDWPGGHIQLTVSISLNIITRLTVFQPC